MTIFGQTLTSEQVFGLAFTLTALLLWVMALGGERSWRRSLRSWEADRKARRDAERAAELRSEAEPPRGPWG